jgi:NADP-dependent 3-hydroxy-3-methylglutaryl-CoA reductase
VVARVPRGRGRADRARARGGGAVRGRARAARPRPRRAGAALGARRPPAHPARAGRLAGAAPGVVPERGHYTESARQARLVWLREHSGAALEALGQTSLDARTLTGNVENLVGTVEVPVGLAGPLLFDGEHARGHVVAPLATTEGALVASVSRGATAITRSGGVQTRVLHQQMVRAPIFELGDVQEAGRFVRWLEDHLEAIRGQVAMVSNHARLLRVEPWQAGRRVHVRFCYATGDAAGQNMTTACTWRACQWINDAVTRVPGIDLAFSAIEGNASGDKKVTSANHLGGRGTRVTAECWIDPATMEEVLKTTPERMMHGHAIGTSGGLQSGILGYSINASNLIAAMFLATGQDVACVHESGAAMFSLEAAGDGIRASMLLPSSSVGPSAAAPRCRPSTTRSRRWLRRPGAGEARGDRVRLRARARPVDAGGGEGRPVADAHERLGRNRPVRWLRAEDWTASCSGRCSASRSRRFEPVDVELGVEHPLEQTARGLGGQKLVGGSRCGCTARTARSTSSSRPSRSTPR